MLYPGRNRYRVRCIRTGNRFNDFSVATITAITAQAIARETGVAVCPLSMIMSGDGDGLDSYCDAISENVETIVNALSEGQVRVQ